MIESLIAMIVEYFLVPVNDECRQVVVHLVNSDNKSSSREQKVRYLPVKVKVFKKKCKTSHEQLKTIKWGIYWTINCKVFNNCNWTISSIWWSVWTNLQVVTEFTISRIAAIVISFLLFWKIPDLINDCNDSNADNLNGPAKFEFFKISENGNTTAGISMEPK